MEKSYHVRAGVGPINLRALTIDLRNFIGLGKAANLRYRDYRSGFRRLYGPRVRSVLGQREVRPDS